MNEQENATYREGIAAIMFLGMGSCLGMSLPTLVCMGLTVLLGAWIFWEIESMRFKAEQKPEDEAEPTN